MPSRLGCPDSGIGTALISSSRTPSGTVTTNSVATTGTSSHVAGAKELVAWERTVKLACSTLVPELSDAVTVACPPPVSTASIV